VNQSEGPANFSGRVLLYSSQNHTPHPGDCIDVGQYALFKNEAGGIAGLHD
jgi:hypothetical protein